MMNGRETETHDVSHYSPQCQTLLTHFQRGKSITNVEAQAVYRMRALPRRVADLKAAGHVIHSGFHFDPTGQRYVRYSYIKGPTVEGLKAKKATKAKTAGSE